MPHFAKPAEGSWTEHHPDLGTAPVNYEDSISPEFHELERDAIFRRTWLNVGRVEQVARVGTYFTRQVDVLRTSIVVVRSSDDRVRAFHNICRHRGNKLAWNDDPREETSGMCRQFTCKYHGWRYDLEGALSFVQQEGEFFDLDNAGLGLVPVECDVWEGFIFVNFDRDNAMPLRDYLGEFGRGLEGYPFGELTQTYKFRAEVGSNWKLFIDAFAEFYHAPILHAKQAVAEPLPRLRRHHRRGDVRHRAGPRPGAEFHGNAYEAEDVPRVPSTLVEAIDELERSEIAAEAFGKDVHFHLVNTAKQEWAAFNRVVTDWERRRNFELI